MAAGELECVGRLFLRQRCEMWRRRSMGSSIREVALRLLGDGFSVIPIKPGGSKAPAIPTFKEFKDRRRPTEDEIRKWFPDDGPDLGVGVICGKISGNLAVMDFETKQVYSEWSELCDHEGLPVRDLPVVSTPRGYHVYVKLPEAEPGRSLAHEMEEVDGKDGAIDTRPKILIEIRAQGQYVVGPGSPASCHETNKGGWNLAWGPEIGETPTITLDQWQGMIRAAKSFNSAPIKSVTSRKVTAAGMQMGVGSISLDDQRPGTDYCRKSSIGEFAELLEKHGWEMLREDLHGGRQIWRRPGKTEPGGSATLGAVTTSLGHCLYVFSTAAAPFEADTCYSLFAVRAILQYDSDFSRCAVEVGAEGYGAEAPEDVLKEVKAEIGRLHKIEKKKNGEQIFTREQIDGFRALSQEFKRTWDRKREKDFGDSACRYDSSLLIFGIRYLGTPERSGVIAGIGLVWMWRRKYGIDVKKAEDAAYLAKKVAWIRSQRSKSDNEVIAGEEQQSAGESKEGRLSWLSERFGLPVRGFIQRRCTVEEASFFLDVDGHRVRVGNGESWEKFITFDRALRCWRHPDGHGIPGYEGSLPDNLRPVVAWSAVMKVLFQVVTLEGVDESMEETLRGWAVDFADQQGVWETSEDNDDWRESAANSRPWVRNRKLHIQLDGFQQYLRVVKSERVDRRSLIDGLVQAGFEHATVQPRMDDGRRPRKKVWTIETANIPVPDQARKTEDAVD